MMMTSKADTPINAENGGVITKKDLVRMFWRSLPMEFSWHYERQMHMGFEFMIGPALKKIYKDDPEGLKEALQYITGLKEKSMMILMHHLSMQ